ncbi:hypothetical protein FISHEDRAFT_58651 [Fistulina hepatica ATCC 64428]|uniref:Uncharacterized protein n=1 Tax=Fistulina hepatica ATCC 64428 TaxID=1128425 RepID=A0A0D7AG29_9AGAR|nr:hypothetical protein FISHEDRAFT_58651 [Fistulina hepatica ATCC 64428]
MAAFMPPRRGFDPFDSLPPDDRPDYAYPLLEHPLAWLPLSETGRQEFDKLDPRSRLAMERIHYMVQRRHEGQPRAGLQLESPAWLDYRRDPNLPAHHPFYAQWVERGERLKAAEDAQEYLKRCMRAFEDDIAQLIAEKDAEFAENHGAPSSRDSAQSHTTFERLDEAVHTMGDNPQLRSLEAVSMILNFVRTLHNVGPLLARSITNCPTWDPDKPHLAALELRDMADRLEKYSAWLYLNHNQEVEETDTSGERDGSTA